MQMVGFGYLCHIIFPTNASGGRNARDVVVAVGDGIISMPFHPQFLGLKPFGTEGYPDIRPLGEKTATTLSPAPPKPKQTFLSGTND